MILAGADVAALLDRMATHDSMRTIPRAELEWLVAHGEFRRYDAGEVMLTPSDQSSEMIVQLSGRIAVYFGHGAGRRHVAESRAGSITGLLPFSRLKRPPSDVLVEEAADLLTVHRDCFPALIRECPALVESLVHNMLDRARRFAAADWQDEKVMSLGRLAAGLAHELNNPATAAASGARRLTRALLEVGAAAHRLGMTPLSHEARARVIAVVEGCQVADRRAAASPMERADLEERLVAWLQDHGAGADCAPTLADGGVGLDTLEELASFLPGGALGVAVEWIAAASAATMVAVDVERATQRIHGVVSAVRSFTQMDRAAVRDATDLARGLADTVDVLGAKARANGVALRLECDPDLPAVRAVPADLNQAWANLVENAIDASSAGGEVVLHARAEAGAVVVRVIDDGHGIPPDVQPRIFDPFFTTKPVGEGIGLGLDIVRRIARNHGGEVEFESQPGRTEFRVRLPAGASPAPVP